VSRDGHVVVSHDQRLNPSLTRTPDGRWLAAPGPAIHALSLRALESYDVGRMRPDSDYARRFPSQRPADGARIPTLDAVLALGPRAGGARIHLNVETKLSPFEPRMAPDPETFARLVVAHILDAGAARRVTVQSFDWRSLRAVAALAPQIRTAYLTAQQDWLDNIQAGRPGASPWTAGIDVDDFGGSIPRMVRHMGGDIWSPFFRDLDRARLEEAKSLDLRVVVWTVNEISDMHRLISLGVDGIITDYPDRLLEVARQRRVVVSATKKGTE